MDLLSVSCSDRLASLAAGVPPGSLLVLEDRPGFLAAGALAILGRWSAPADRHDAHPDGARWSVEEVREQLLAPVQVMPQGRHLVVVYRAEEMDVRAAEMALKTFEEPPSPATFVLVVRDAARLLPTIRSRASLVVGLEAASGGTLTAMLVDLLGAARAARFDGRCGAVVDLVAELAERPDLDDDLAGVVDVAYGDEPFSVARTLGRHLARVASNGATEDLTALKAEGKTRLRRLLDEVVAARERHLAALAPGVADPCSLQSLQQARRDVALVRRAMTLNTPASSLLPLLCHEPEGL